MAKTFSRWVRARLLGGALIVGYHRIAAVTLDEYELCVTPRHFAEHIEAVKKYAHPISLSELVRCLKEGSVPSKAVAVTFDDGYADTLYTAKPVLERYEVPATVFVCTGYAGEEFWWDELERLVMSSKAHLDALDLGVGAKSFLSNQPEAGSVAGFDARRKFRHALYDFLIGLDVEDQNHVMNRIRSWSGIPSSETTVCAMNHDELLRLADGGLIELGAHTRHHPLLPQLSPDRQKEEIEASKRDLESLLGKEISGFAYPNGRANEHTKRIVRELGFTYACTSLHDVVRPGQDMYELARFWQQDIDGDRFMRRLNRWIHG
jgi:peptidoglycan/xylan/chitin deacetylase (PgdA/CDA1 family)